MTIRTNEDYSHIDFTNKFTAFTDGSALKNSKDAPAGMACYFPKYKVLISKGMRCTNNVAELEAMRTCLRYFVNHYINTEIPENTFYIFSDSEYTINAVSGKNKVNTNKEIIFECKRLIETINRKCEIKFMHVYSHTNAKDFVSVNNEIVDLAARNEANKMKDALEQ